MKKSVKKPEAPTRESMEPYPCFCSTCKNKITPTKVSRPWFCPECTNRMRKVIREQEAKQAAPPMPKHRGYKYNYNRRK